MSTSFAGKKDKELYKQYTLAKSLYFAEDYENAMAQFKSISDAGESDTRGNARYWYALTAFKLQKYTDANFMLHKLIEEDKSCKPYDEALYLYANTALETGSYYKVYSHGNKIQDQGIKNQLESMKMSYYQQLDADSLFTILSRYPEDRSLAVLIAKKIRIENDQLGSKEKLRLGYLLQDYALDSAFYYTGSRSVKMSERKDTFTVAALLPLSLDTYQEVNTQFRPKYYYELLEGLKLAVEKNNFNVNTPYIKLYMYDVNQKGQSEKELLASRELSSMDLVLGSVGKHLASFEKYAGYHQVPVVDIFGRIGRKPQEENIYYHLPSYATEGAKVADFLYIQQMGGVSFIYFDPSSEKKLQAAEACAVRLENKGIQVCLSPVNNESAQQLKEEILTYVDSTIHSIVVFSDDNLVKSNLISALENGDIKAPVIVDHKWLDYKAVEFEQYKRRNFYFVYPGYIDTKRYYYPKFRQRFEEVVGIVPIKKYAYWGFDLMTFWTKILADYGTVFQSQLKERVFTPGFLTTGYIYETAADNQLVPLIHFDDAYNFECVNCTK
ncbi:MAG: tol-pal system YbgF family protein [Cyclobacteriaceae bacterium]